jgi:hypothetical protein
MTTDNFCFYWQNRQIQTSQTGGQWYCDTSPFSIPWPFHPNHTLVGSTTSFGLLIRRGKSVFFFFAKTARSHAGDLRFIYTSDFRGRFRIKLCLLLKQLFSTSFFKTFKPIAKSDLRVKQCFRWQSMHDNAINSNTRQWQLTTYLGHLGQRNINRNNPICVALPKVPKASTYVTLSLVLSLAFLPTNVTNVNGP